MANPAGRLLAPAILVVALTLSPALGYATTPALLGLAALGTILLVAARYEGGAHPTPALPVKGRVPAGGESAISPQAPDHTSPLTGEAGRGWARNSITRPNSCSLFFLTAFALITLTALITARSPADLLPLFGFSALLFHAPLTRLLAPSDRLPGLALTGSLVGLATALFLHFGQGAVRAGQGFFLTDPYRLAVTTLLCAMLGLGALFSMSRWRWLSLLGPVAALIVIALTGSRTALLGVPLLLLVTALCFARRGRTIATVLAAAVLLIVAALFVELPGSSRFRLWDALADIANGNRIDDVSISVRLRLYRYGIEHFFTSPLFGHGWSEAIMAPLVARFPPDQESLNTLVHLHNDAIHFAVAGGVPGVLAWLLMLVAPIVGYFQLLAASRTRQRLHMLLVLAVGYFILGLPDVMLASPLQLTLYVVLSAVVVGKQQR